MSTNVSPSTPGAPPFARQSPYACARMSSRHTLSYRAWNRLAGSCLAVTYSVRWSRRIRSGVARLTPIPHSSARPNAPRTRAPSLHRRYPASSVLWAPPTPVAPGPLQDRWPVARPARQASRVASHRVRTCCAHYPGEPIDLHPSVRPVDRSGLRPWRGDSALALDLSRLAQASLALRPVRLLTRQRGPLSPGLRRVGRPSRRPGRYPGVPTRPGAGLAPAAWTDLSRHALQYVSIGAPAKRCCSGRGVPRYPRNFDRSRGRRVCDVEGSAGRFPPPAFGNTR